MATLTSSEMISFLIAVSLMLGLGRIFGELFRKIKQAAVVGEIIAGILLGPTILGNISPEAFTWLFPATGSGAAALDGLVNLSIIFMLLVVGFEIDLSVVLQQGKAALLTGAVGMVVPFLFGGSFALIFPGLFGAEETGWIFPFFIGTALAISALPIIARTLMDLNLFKSRLGMMIMAAAMFNDFIGWIIFSIFIGLAGQTGHGHGGPSVITTIGLTLLFVVIMLTAVRKVIHLILPRIQSNFSWPGGIISFVMVAALLGAAVTEKLGVHSIFGAFIVGVAIGDSTHISERTKEIIHQFITNIFAPLFFVSIGLKINFIEAFNPVIVTAIVLLGFAGKIIGCGAGAKLAGFNKSESLATGFAMNARGVLEIVLGIVALGSGIINNEIFVAIIILVLLSSLLSGPLINLFSGESRGYSLLDIIDSKSVVFTDVSSGKEIIGLLSEKISGKAKMNSEKIFGEVWAREQEIPTGIANGLAIPHARTDISKPAILIAINKTGIDFEAPDGKPARVIALLLTPKNKNEIQLQLLAELANRFREKDTAEKLASASSAEEFILAMKQT